MNYTPEVMDRWFDNVRREFCPLAKRFTGKRVTYLEIGCWAGGSGAWVCENVLTHPESKAVGIDPYPPARKKYDIEKIKAMSASRVAAIIGGRWKWIYKPSHEGLLDARAFLGNNSVDFFYVDGSHDASDVVTDFALCWPMLKVGALIIFDDYHTPRTHMRSWPDVKDGVNAIALGWRDLIRPLDTYHRRQKSFEVLRKEQVPLRQRV